MRIVVFGTGGAGGYFGAQLTRAGVEQALAGDPQLARRYDLVRQELAETIHLNRTLGEPSARAMEKLFAAIDGEEAGAPRRRRRRISRPLSLETAST